MNAAAYDFIPGTSPLIISMPHVGTELMPEVAAGLAAVRGRLAAASEFW